MSRRCSSVGVKIRSNGSIETFKVLYIIALYVEASIFVAAQIDHKDDGIGLHL